MGEFGVAMSPTGGISSRNRQALEALHRAARGAFTVSDAASILNISESRARRLVRYFAQRGWLARARRGLYVAVPLDAGRSGEWTADTWVLAHKTFSPCYVGGWSACEYWGLTDQLFRDLVVLTTRRVRNKSVALQGTPIQLRHISQALMFGTRGVWRGVTKVAVSDPSRTVVDILRDPGLGGGISHVAEVLQQYFQSEHRNDHQLIEYGDAIHNRTVFKRLGYLLGLLQISTIDLLDACRQRTSAGITNLDPTSAARGRIARQWNLRINVDIRPPDDH
jgi:predicted transcriptional regulator of viral defense system